MSAGPRLIPNIGGEEESRGQPPPAVETVARLWRLLFSRRARLLDEEEKDDLAWPAALGARPDDDAFPWLNAEREVVAWLNTEAAARAADAADAPLAGAPPDVVRAVHDKAFAHRVCEEAGLVPEPLRGLIAVFEASELEDADAALRRIQRQLDGWPAWTQGRFALKPRVGGSGRGRVAGSAGRADSAELRAALPRLARQGGALLEPWLRRRCDLSVQLRVAPDGALTLLGTLEQQVSAAGAFRGHGGAIDHKARVVSESRHDDALVEAAVSVARAAHARGYCGPCGIDAFEFEGPDGPALRPVAEFNARFTTGTVLVGLLRRARQCIADQLEFASGARRAFRFHLDEPPEGPAPAPGLLRLPLARDGERLRPALWVTPHAGSAPGA